MKPKLYTLPYRLAVTLLAVFLLPSLAEAQEAKWELFYTLPSTYTFHITKEGHMLATDYVWDETGGINLSTDGGQTWQKTDAPNYKYSDIIEGNGYVFAAGMGAHIVRSADGGQTWEVLSYARALDGLVASADQDWTACYAMAFHKGRLFIADFTGGGVIYSDDEGETWQNTDTESMSVEIDDGKQGGKMVENLYNLVSFNGDLYAFGVYCVYKLDEETMKWSVVRTDSNFMAVSAMLGDKLVCGRSVMNEAYDAHFLEMTADGVNWEVLPRPEGLIDNDVRCLFAEGNLLVAAMQTRGIYCTDNAGERWYDISAGLPDYTQGEKNGYYLSPLTMVADADYLYVAVFDASPAFIRNESGVYRMKKSDLPVYTGIESVQAEGVQPRLSADGQRLLLPQGCTGAAVYDLTGRVACQGKAGAADGSSLSLGALADGTYIYKVQLGARTVEGKFVKGNAR